MPYTTHSDDDGIEFQLLPPDQPLMVYNGREFVPLLPGKSVLLSAGLVLLREMTRAEYEAEFPRLELPQAFNINYTTR